jgi:hypothetical protein
MNLGFFDCGAHGKKIGLIPLNISEATTLTASYRSMSSDVDWSEFHSYRVNIRAYDKIEVWVDNFSIDPMISIPWKQIPLLQGNGDLGIGFGHFEAAYAGTSEWEYIRLGLSTGYDVSMAHDVLKAKPHIFDGRALAIVRNTV